MATTTTRAPAVDWREHPDVRDLASKVAKLATERDDALRAIPAAEAAVDQAAAALEEAEVNRLVGNIDERAETTVRKTLERAQESLARLRARARVAERAIASVESSGAVVTDPAKLASRAELHRQYAAAIADMDRALAAAQAANDRVGQIFDAAQEIFGTSHRSSRAVQHLERAGLTFMTWHELGGWPMRGDPNLSKLDTWRAEAREAGWLE